MGKRGPAPKPTRLRLLHGDQPCRINTDEPLPDPAAPQCPPGVADDVREVWDYTLRQLIVMGVATMADRDALLCFCEAVVTHRKASAILAKSPILVAGAIKGTVIRNPAIQIQRDAAQVVAALAGKFGFTPSARSEIHRGGAAGHGEQSSAERYLSG
jgi:P27 family predicted phage terminase small subunit